MAMTFHRKRALLASPLLLLSIFIFNRMDIIQLSTLGSPPVMAYTIDKLFNVRVLDEFWAPVAGSFAHSTHGYDPVSWWQATHFLFDAMTLFVVCLLEGSRGGRWPISVLVIAQICQIIPIGVFSPIAYFVHLSFFPPTPIPTKRPSYMLLLAAIVLFSGHSSVLLMYLHPSLESRAYWTWIWQLYPLWTGLLFAASLGFSRLGLHSGISSVKMPLSTILAVPAGLSALAWWWLLLQTPFKLGEVLLPSWYIEPGSDFPDAMRRLLQWDEIGAGVAALFWLGTLCADVLAVRAPGEVITRGATVLIAAVVGLMLVGPGPVFVALWAWREAMIFGRGGLKV